MTDIVDRLRYCVGNPSAWDHYDEGMSEKLREAADTIERLRVEVDSWKAEAQARTTSVIEVTRKAADEIERLRAAISNAEVARRALEPKP